MKQTVTICVLGVVRLGGVWIGRVRSGVVGYGQVRRSRAGLVGAALSVLTACASTPPSAQQVTLSEAPSWYTQPPKATDTFFAAGTATAADMQMSADLADLSAKRAIAAKIGTTLSGSIMERATTTSQPYGERFTKDLIAGVTVADYKTVERKTVLEGPGYRTFVLLSIPIVKPAEEAPPAVALGFDEKALQADLDRAMANSRPATTIMIPMARAEPQVLQHGVIRPKSYDDEPPMPEAVPVQPVERE